MAWKLMVNAVDRTTIVDEFSMAVQLNERARASVLLSNLLPDRFHEVVSYAKDGVTPLFGGVILRRALEGYTQYDADFRVRCECGDYFTFADWCYTTVEYTTDRTLKQILQDLVADHLTDYGITLAAGQVDGPTIAAFTWTDKRVSDAIRELSDRTGYVARISAAKVLQMSLPGSASAPVSITDAAPHSQEVTWDDSDRVPANKVIIIAGPTGALERTQVWTADGVATSWVADVPSVSGYMPGYVTVGGVFKTVGTGANYEWNPATSTLTLGTDPSGTPTFGTLIELVYQAQYPIRVEAGGGSPPIEYLEARPDVLDPAQALEIAEGLLAALDVEPRQLHVQTDEDGFDVGQSLTVNLPLRQVVGTFVITSLSKAIVVDTDQGDAYWQYQMEAIDSSVYQGSYLDQWRKMTGGSSSGISVVSGGGGGVGGSTVLSSPFFLGGSRTLGVAPNPAAWTPAVDFVEFVATAAFTGRVRATIRAEDAGVTVKARLRNVTDATDVESSPVTSTTFTDVEVISPILSGKRYRLELHNGTSDKTAFGIGTLEALV